MRWGRILVAALAVGLLSIAVLVLVVAVFGPGEKAAAQEYAQRLGLWVGPVSGAVFCVLGGWWVARGLRENAVANGTALGLLVAAIDVALLLASGAAFQPIFAVSNLLWIAAGALGGWLASRASLATGAA